MIVTGIEIQEALRLWKIRRTAAEAAFPNSFKKYDDEDKASPQELEKELILCEDAISSLETIQSIFNNQVSVTIKGEDYSLSYAVRRLGGATRLEKLWSTQVAPEPDRYAARIPRSVEHVIEKQTITTKEITKSATGAAQVSSLFRRAIAAGNASRIDVGDFNKDFLTP